jgi:hypothetical protein
VLTYTDPKGFGGYNKMAVGGDFVADKKQAAGFRNIYNFVVDDAEAYVIYPND